MAGSYKNIFSAFGQLLWPAKCLCCDTLVPQNADGLCYDCMGKLQSGVIAHCCRRCGCEISPYAFSNDRCPNCPKQKFHFDHIAVASRYSGVARKLILDLKDNRKTQNSRFLSLMLNTILDVADFKDKIDMIVPVPLHWRRRFKRGYNQAHILAKDLSIDRPVSTDLVRVKNTFPQFTLNFHQRQKNIEGAFAARFRHDFDGRRICLIDDLKTTGVTLNECAKTLKDEGAKEVFAAVIAIAGQGNT
jgi:competence protein ComFC